MSRHAMNVAKGVGAIVATTMVVGYVGKKVKSKNPRKMKRKATKAIHSMGNVVNELSYILK